MSLTILLDYIIMELDITTLPFAIGDKKKIAVKTINNWGIESFVVKELK